MKNTITKKNNLVKNQYNHLKLQIYKKYNNEKEQSRLKYIQKVHI